MIFERNSFRNGSSHSETDLLIFQKQMQVNVFLFRLPTPSTSPHLKSVDNINRTMIRHTTTGYLNQDNDPTNRISSIPFYSAIKSKKFESLDHREQTNVTMSATMPRFRFCFNDNENSHFDDNDANMNHKVSQ